MPLLLAPLLLAACTVGPNYVRPNVSVDPAYELPPQTQPASTQPAASQPAAEPAWWRLLKDEKLDALIATAQENNLDLQQAAARIREARAQRGVAVGGEFPTVNSSTSYQRVRESQNAAPFNAFPAASFPWEFDNYQLGFDASWELDVFGGTRRNIEAATGNLLASIEDQHAVLVTLQGEVARNYVDLRSAQRQLEIARHNLELQNQVLALTRDRMRTGLGSELDVARAAALVATTAADIPVFDRAATQAIYRLAVLTHQPLEKLADLRTQSPIPAAPANVLVGVPADLLRRRPDIRRAERQLAAATARIGVAEAALYPRFSISGFFNMQSESIEDLFDWRSRAFGIGPTIAWPIFEAGRLRGVVQVRTAQQEQALTAYERTIETAIEDVRDQMVIFSTERQRHESLVQAVASNRQALELATSSYTQGLVDFLTVLDAQRQLDQAENTLARSDAQLAQSVIAISKALGGGWENQDAKVTNEK
jgi:NodT family efflux transporter outer membrane factor (OMF) lipoprotein